MLSIFWACVSLMAAPVMSQQICDELIIYPYLTHFGFCTWISDDICFPIPAPDTCTGVYPPSLVQSYGPEDGAFVVVNAEDPSYHTLTYTCVIGIPQVYANITLNVSLLALNSEYFDMDFVIGNQTLPGLEIFDTNSEYLNFSYPMMVLETGLYEFSLNVQTAGENVTAYLIVNGIWLTGCYERNWSWLTVILLILAAIVGITLVWYICRRALHVRLDYIEIVKDRDFEPGVELRTPK